MTQTLKLADDLFPSLLAGKKCATVRAGARAIELGELLFESVSGTQRASVEVYEVRHKALSRLTNLEAAADGATSAEELARALKRFYPSLGPNDAITVVLHSAASTAPNAKRDRHA